MRIISDFKDVYDLQHSMFDKERTWTRRTGEVLVKRNPDQPRLTGISRRFLGKDAYMFYFPVFLGNRVYYVFAFYEDRKFITSTVIASKAVEIAEGLGIKGLNFFQSSLEKDFHKLTTELLEKSQLAFNLFLELRTPLAYIHSEVEAVPDENSKQKVDCYKIITCPQLHNSIIPWSEIDGNVYRLHQHLEQYIFGVLGTGEPEMLTTSDRDRLEAKGFDYVTSFRKMPREN